MSAISDIEAIQTILQVEPDGDIGKITTAALKALDDEGKIERIQAILQPYTDETLSPAVVGPRTLRAMEILDEKGRIERGGSTPPPASDSSTGDERSEKNIATLDERVKPLARQLIADAAKDGITIKVLSGTRTYEQQNDLYEQGRSKPGRIVTNARGGFSNHNFGIAFDIGVFKGGKYIEEGPEYRKVGHLGKQLGLEWGGYWKSIQDEPHFQLRPNWAAGLKESSMLAELRSRRESGKPIFTA